VSEYSDLDPAFLPILRRCQPATMTSVERIYALYRAAEYLSVAQIAGNFVEWGVLARRINDVRRLRCCERATQTDDSISTTHSRVWVHRMWSMSISVAGPQLLSS
jgi:hypothetical protein